MSTAVAPRFGSRLSVYGVQEALESWARLVESNDGVVTEEVELALLAAMEQAPQAVDQAAGLVKALEAECAEIREEEKRLADRRRCVEKQAATVRLAIGVVMDRAGAKSCKGRFTVSRIAGRESVEIVDGSAVPEQYLVPQPPVVDKKAIAEAIKSGETVPGAEMVRGAPSIAIK